MEEDKDVKEHSAKIINALLELTPDDRVAVFCEFCCHCGEATPGFTTCHCMNDE